MAVKLSISLDEKVLEDLDAWCIGNGNLKRSHAIAFMTTQWLQSQKNLGMLTDLVGELKKANLESGTLETIIKSKLEDT